jgi:hypothetical protein
LILLQASSAALCSSMVTLPKIHPHKEETWLNFYTRQHKQYCGIDLHARAMYVCILDQHGTKLVHKNLPTTPDAFLRVIALYRDDLVVGVEGMFTWYWLADLCARKGIAFVLGHALSMKAIHGGKAQYNLPEIGKKLAYKANREGVEAHFPDPRGCKTIEVDIALIDHYDQLLSELAVTTHRLFLVWLPRPVRCLRLPA